MSTGEAVPHDRFRLSSPTGYVTVWYAAVDVGGGRFFYVGKGPAGPVLLNGQSWACRYRSRALALGTAEHVARLVDAGKVRVPATDRT